jgi:hypothetical protein
VTYPASVKNRATKSRAEIGEFEKPQVPIREASSTEQDCKYSSTDCFDPSGFIDTPLGEVIAGRSGWR